MEALGFNLKYFLFQLLNFAVLFFVLKRLLTGPLLGVLDKRNREIAEGLENAERMREALAETEARQRELVEQARQEGRALVERTRTEAEALAQRLRDEARASAAKILENAEQELQLRREEQYRALRGELAAMVLTATEKVLGETLGKEEKRRRIAALTKELPHG